MQNSHRTNPPPYRPGFLNLRPVGIPIIEAFFLCHDHDDDDYEVRFYPVLSLLRGALEEEGFVLRASLGTCLQELVDWDVPCDEVNWCDGFMIDGIMIEAPWIGPNGKFNQMIEVWIKELWSIRV